MADEKANKVEKTEKSSGASGGGTAQPQSLSQPSQPPKFDLAGLSPKELLSALDGLKPEQLLAVRQAAIDAGLAPPVKEGKDSIILPDGRVKVTVIFDVDLGAQLKVWAESQNSTLANFVVEAMTSYVQMDWSSVGEAPVTASK